jgi:hypothetical protein
VLTNTSNYGVYRVLDECGEWLVRPDSSKQLAMGYFDE